MSDDSTLPMQQQQWSRRETDPDEQETVFADQDAVTPPTMPLGDRGGWQPTPAQGFVRADPGPGVRRYRGPVGVGLVVATI